MSLDIQATGVGEAVKDLDRVSKRMANMKSAFERVIPVLEAGEARHFAGLGGRYVDTGALRDSLTQDGAGAIREAHGAQLVFGTDIFYARFLRKGKKSAVLVLKPIERKRSAKTILDFITEGLGN